MGLYVILRGKVELASNISAAEYFPADIKYITPLDRVLLLKQQMKNGEGQPAHEANIRLIYKLSTANITR